MLLRAIIAAVLLTSTTSALALAAPPAAAPAREHGLDVAGLWRFDMASPQGATTLGAMTVLKNQDTSAYEGKVITIGGVEALPIRSIQIQSRRMTMKVDSPRGLVVFKGDLHPSGQTFSGTLTYHDGRNFSMDGVKQQALLPPRPTRAIP